MDKAESLDLLKSHIDAYTRKDGVVVQAHEDGRPSAKDHMAALSNKYNDHLIRKGTEWRDDGKKIPAHEIPDGAPEYTHKEVYGHDGKTSPAGDDFSSDFTERHRPAENPRFIIKHKDGSRHFVDTEGGNYARYHMPVDGYEHGDGGEDASKPAGVDPYDHAISSGAARKSGVRVYADAWAAHRAAARDTKAAVVMKHPAHDKHVVVNLSDGAKMEKNGYKVVKQK